MNAHVLYVSGTHCPACKVLVEDLLGEQDGVEAVAVDLRQQQITVQTEAPATLEQLIQKWTPVLRPHGYGLSIENPGTKRDHRQLIPAILIGLLVLAGFFAAQRSGILAWDLRQPLTPATAILIGVVASFSSCLAVVGGFVLSLSSQLAQDTRSLRPVMSFHVGRIAGFVVLGGALGLLGQAIAINFTAATLLGLVAAVVMVLLGLNLTGLFNVMQFIALPRGAFDRLTRIETGAAAPFLLGALTFFLPCGFTQSMQVAALASGSPVTGALIMGMFALGTLPMLSLLSFGSFRFAHSRYAPLFLQSVGVVVIGFGLFAILTGLAGLGVIPPLVTL